MKDEVNKLKAQVKADKDRYEAVINKYKAEVTKLKDEYYVPGFLTQNKGVNYRKNASAGRWWVSHRVKIIIILVVVLAVIGLIVANSQGAFDEGPKMLEDADGDGIQDNLLGDGSDTKVPTGTRPDGSPIFGG